MFLGNLSKKHEDLNSHIYGIKRNSMLMILPSMELVHKQLREKNHRKKRIG